MENTDFVRPTLFFQTEFVTRSRKGKSSPFTVALRAAAKIRGVSRLLPPHLFIPSLPINNNPLRLAGSISNGFLRPLVVM